MSGWRISSPHSGFKLLAYLKTHFPEASNAEIKRSLEANCCKVNGRIERFGSHVLGEGDLVEFYAQQIESTVPEERILFEDQDLLFYNKPSKISSEGLLPDLILLHRLDKDTTGVLLFAKHEEAAECMLEQFKNRQVHKQYLAIVDGIPKTNRGRIENTLGVIKKYEGQTMWGERKGGAQALTEWELTKKGKDCALLTCFPKTGRTHQLRVHLSEMGHPILGDGQYGHRFHCPYFAPRQLLHAEKLTFLHPFSHHKIEVQAPLPYDFQAALQELFT